MKKLLLGIATFQLLTLSTVFAQQESQFTELWPKHDNADISASSNLDRYCQMKGYDKVDFFETATKKPLVVFKIDDQGVKTFRSKTQGMWAYQLEKQAVVFKIGCSDLFHTKALGSALEVATSNFKKAFDERNGQEGDPQGNIYSCLIRGLKPGAGIETIGNAKFRATVAFDSILPSCNELVNEKVCIKRNKKNDCTRFEEKLVTKNVCRQNISHKIYEGVLSDLILFNQKDQTYLSEYSVLGYTISTNYIVKDDLSLVGEISSDISSDELPSSVVDPSKEVIGHVYCKKQ